MARAQAGASNEASSNPPKTFTVSPAQRGRPGVSGGVYSFWRSMSRKMETERTEPAGFAISRGRTHRAPRAERSDRGSVVGDSDSAAGSSSLRAPMTARP
jgi:hypothetical protein